MNKFLSIHLKILVIINIYYTCTTSIKANFIHILFCISGYSKLPWRYDAMFNNRALVVLSILALDLDICIGKIIDK